MSSQMKGLIGTVFGFFSFFTIPFFNILRIRTGLILGLIIPLMCSILAFYFGRQARNAGTRILGMAALSLGVIGILIWVINIFVVIVSR